MTRRTAAGLLAAITLGTLEAAYRALTNRGHGNLAPRR